MMVKVISFDWPWSLSRVAVQHWQVPWQGSYQSPTSWIVASHPSTGWMDGSQLISGDPWQWFMFLLVWFWGPCLAMPCHLPLRPIWSRPRTWTLIVTLLSHPRRGVVSGAKTWWKAVYGSDVLVPGHSVDSLWKHVMKDGWCRWVLSLVHAEWLRPWPSAREVGIHQRWGDGRNFDDGFRLFCHNFTYVWTFSGPVTHFLTALTPIMFQRAPTRSHSTDADALWFPSRTLLNHIYPCRSFFLHPILPLDDHIPLTELASSIISWYISRSL